MIFVRSRRVDIVNSYSLQYCEIRLIMLHVCRSAATFTIADQPKSLGTDHTLSVNDVYNQLQYM